MKAVVEGYGDEPVEIVTDHHATFWMGRPQYFILNDPEFGVFDSDAFEETNE